MAATQHQYDITLYNPTMDPTNFAADVYMEVGSRKQRVRVHCGCGGQTPAQAMQEATDFIKEDLAQKPVSLEDHQATQNKVWCTDRHEWVDADAADLPYMGGPG